MPSDRTIRAFAIDDERLALDRLRRLLHDTGRVEVVGASTDPEAALEQLRAQPVDVIFLDIQMPELSGFDLLARLDADVPVIFTTAFDQYAIEAFAVNSVDYLLKPIEPADWSMRSTSWRLTGEARPDVRTLARELAAHLAPGRKLERIASRVAERTTSRRAPHSAKDKLTFAIVAGREHVVDYTLAQLEERLDARRFVRAHRGAIVNVGFVDELYPDVDGGMLVRLKDEKKTVLSVARDRVRTLRQRLGI